MTYEEWENQVPERIKRELIWNFAGYRKALFLYDLIWEDTADWTEKDSRAHKLVWQIVGSSGSISANLEEGLGRGYGKEMLYHYRVALASARETKGWLYRGHHMMSPTTLEQQLALADEVIALLVDELNRQKARTSSSR